MRKMRLLLSMLAFTLVSLTSCQKEDAQSNPVKVELLSPFWSFPTSNVPLGTLSQSATTDDLSLPDDLTKGFTIRFTAHLKPVDQEQCILEIPQV